MKTVISRQEFHLMAGLLLLARHYNARMREIERTLNQLLEVEEGGHTSDAMWEGYEPEKLLDRLGVRVSPPFLSIEPGRAEREEGAES